MKAIEGVRICCRTTEKCQNETRVTNIGDPFLSLFQRNVSLEAQQTPTKKTHQMAFQNVYMKYISWIGAKVHDMSGANLPLSWSLVFGIWVPCFGFWVREPRSFVPRPWTIMNEKQGLKRGMGVSNKDFILWAFGFLQGSIKWISVFKSYLIHHK